MSLLRNAMLSGTVLLSFVAVPHLAQSQELPPLASPLTFDAASALALQEQPGKIVEIALEHVNGGVVIDIEVETEAGEEVEFHLDPESGDILATWVDDDPSDDPGDTDPDG